MSEYLLTTELMKLSSASKWDEAKLEWDVSNIERVEEFETCLCGHFPIIEVCTIYNEKTRKEARVGNCCVKKFNEKSDKIFKAVGRVKKDPEKAVNSETLLLAVKNNWIDTKSFSFYLDIIRKRKLSERQLAWKKRINEKIVYYVNKKKSN